jgi:hypothetical protein
MPNAEVIMTYRCLICNKTKQSDEYMNLKWGEINYGKLISPGVREFTGDICPDCLRKYSHN